MRKLIWKDYRLNRSLLILAMAVVVSVYTVGVGIEVSHTWPTLPSAQTWSDTFASYSHLALVLTPYIAAIIGGNSIACERADRSAHFLAYLPPSKRQILASKFCVGVVSMTILWGANLISMYVIAPLISHEPVDSMRMLGSPAATIAGCVLPFGLGWLGSANCEKPTFPVLIGLSSPVVLGFLLIAAALLVGVSRFEVMKWAPIVSVCLGLVAFIVGSWCYLRRSEP